MSASSKPQAVPLSAVATIDNRKSVGLKPYVGLEDISNDTGAFLGSHQPRAVKSATFAFDGRHVLYGRLRAYLNKALTPDFEGHCSTEIFPILPSEKLDRRYLFYWLTWQPTCDRISATGRGARMPRANMHEVMEFEIPLPPLEEQKRIVAVLDQAVAALDRALALAEANLADADKLFENSLDALFNSIREQSRLSRLEEICTIGDGNHSSKYPKRDEMVEQGVPFLRSSNIQDGTIVADDLLYISPKKHQELNKGHLRAGDILFTNRGEIGKVAILPKEFDGANLNSQVAWLRSSNTLNAEFLFYYLQSGFMRRHYQNAQTGAALQQFPIKMVKAIEVPVPGLEDQHAIAEQLGGLRAKVADLANSYASKRDAIADLRQSLLQKAFAGELT